MWESIKRYFANLWERLSGFVGWIWLKIKNAFAWLSAKLGDAGQYLLTAGVVILLLIASIFVIQQWPGQNRPDSNPEVAQGPRPSIGEALNPDVNIEVVDNPDKDKTITQGEPKPEAGKVEGQQTEYVAPPTGLDPNKPVRYYNDELGFKTTLPPRSTITEQGSTVNMYSESGQLLATVTVVKAQDSLADIKTQLSFSPEISGLKDAQFASKPALSYSVNQLNGYALTHNGHIYYLTGNSQTLAQFSI